jgi:hypothetical protein
MFCPRAWRPKTFNHWPDSCAHSLQVGNEYNYDASEYVYYDNGGVSIRVSECEVMTKAAAQELGDQSRARYQAKRDAEKAAAAGDLIGLHVNQ